MAERDSPRRGDNEASSASVLGVEQREQEPYVQHQPEGMGRLANLMAQYIELQMARPERSTTVHEQFMKLNPPEFVGTTDPLVAEEWLKKLGAIFEVMGVNDDQKLVLATFMLRGEARNWWEAMRRMATVQTWQKFVEIFNEQYFPLVYRYQKEQEFISLKQGKMTVAEYEEQFTALSRFAPDLVLTEGAKCRRFQQGLELKIRSKISVFEIIKYAELVNKAKIVERDVKERSGRLEQLKKRKFDTGVETTVDQSQAQVNSRSGGAKSSS